MEVLREKNTLVLDASVARLNTTYWLMSTDKGYRMSDKNAISDSGQSVTPFTLKNYEL